MTIRKGPIVGPWFAAALIWAGALNASPALDFGPTVEVARPQGGYVGRMRLEPNHGEIGSPSVTVNLLKK
ncbi:MAG TPA: hypothetical protein VIV14_06135, partial [Gammaproteobacteria bacterium]